MPMSLICQCIESPPDRRKVQGIGVTAFFWLRDRLGEDTALAGGIIVKELARAQMNEYAQ